MEEYLRKFIAFDDDLLWSKDIDEAEDRLRLWLASEECKEMEQKRISEEQEKLLIQFNDNFVEPCDNISRVTNYLGVEFVNDEEGWRVLDE